MEECVDFIYPCRVRPSDRIKLSVSKVTSEQYERLHSDLYEIRRGGGCVSTIYSHWQTFPWVWEGTSQLITILSSLLLAAIPLGLGGYQSVDNHLVISFTGSHSPASGRVQVS